MANDLRLDLSEDRKSLSITMSRPTTKIVLNSAEAVEKLMHKLAGQRSKMIPEVSRSAGTKIRAVRDPAWVTRPDIMMNDPILSIRDTRFGWLHYSIPKVNARKLAGFLQAQVDAPEKPKGKEN